MAQENAARDFALTWQPLPVLLTYSVSSVAKYYYPLCIGSRFFRLAFFRGSYNRKIGKFSSAILRDGAAGSGERFGLPPRPEDRRGTHWTCGNDDPGCTRKLARPPLALGDHRHHRAELRHLPCNQWPHRKGAA